MSTDTQTDSALRVKCVCERELRIAPELLGRVFRCPHCRRSLRVGLQFLLADEPLAPNITVLCPCGRFVVAPVRMAGRAVPCKACGQHLLLPEPVERPGGPRLVRVPPHMLERHLRLMRGKEEPDDPAASRLASAGHRGRISLRPGQQLCVNAECAVLVPRGSNVCLLCGTNQKSRTFYEGPGPERDPKGKWKPA